MSAIRNCREPGAADRAWEALGRGEPARAAGMIREGLEAWPEDGRLARLAAVCDRLDRPAADPDLDALRAVLPGDRREARSAHLVLLHGGDEARASERLAVGERVVGTFVLSMTALGFEPRLPAERLIAVEFDDHDAYAAFLRAEGAAPFLDTTGYFHPTRRVVVTFDLERTPPTSPARRRLAGLDLAAVALGTATHETVHQLILATGICPEMEAFPRWLHEGLAMQFEAAPGGVWSGFHAVQPIRLADWRAATGRHSLRALIRDEGLDRGYQRVRYAEAWALVYYLIRDRPAEFTALLDLLRLPIDPDCPPRDRVERAFAAAFGADLDAIERDWTAAIDALARPMASADRRVLP